MSSMSQAQEYTCRAAELHEVDLFLSLWQDLGWEPHEDYPAAIRRAVGQDGFRVICSRVRIQGIETNEPLGCLIASQYGTLGFIGYFCILPGYKGRGLGTILLQHSISYLQAIGCTSIGLDAVPTAARMYERHGFKSSGKKITWYTRSICPSTEESMDTTNSGGSNARIQEILREDKENLEGSFRYDLEITGFDRSHTLAELLSTSNWHLWMLTSQVNKPSDPSLMQEPPRGYIATRPIPGGHAIGPLYAQTFEDAIVLLEHVVDWHIKHSSSSSDGNRGKLCFAAETCSFNPQTQRLFEECKWQEDSHYYHRMWLGPEPEVQMQQTDRIYAVLDSGLG